MILKCKYFFRFVKKIFVVLIIVFIYIFFFDNVSIEDFEDVDEFYKGEGGEELERFFLVIVLTFDYGSRRYVDVSYRTIG